MYLFFPLAFFDFVFDCVDLAKNPKIYIQNYFTSLKRNNLNAIVCIFSQTIALCPRGRDKGVNLSTFLTTKVEHFFVFCFCSPFRSMFSFFSRPFHTCLNEWLFHFICSSLRNFSHRLMLLSSSQYDGQKYQFQACIFKCSRDSSL